MKTFKIGMPRITQPNMVGELVRETPKMLVIKITKRTFETKSSRTLTHKFTKSDRKWYGDKCGFERRFWKENGKEVGGDAFIISSN